MLQTFLPICLLTFAICLFIFLLQFIWRYMDEIVGKGLEYKVIAELFFYAAIGLVPNALPISILFASLMAFGNLGESFELVSMKSAGIPLMRIMKPLIFFMIFVCIALYLFQNHVIPETQKRMYTLLYSVKRKAPELEIPVGSFYSQIDGYNLYVKKKTPATGLLEDLTIYRLTDGFENATIIVADSGYLKMTDDKQALMFYLYKGELFGNLEKQQYAKDKVPYRREIFDQKQILIPFDANFNRMDDSFMKDKYVSKNTAQLQQTADSLTLFVDSLRRTEAISLKKYTYFSGTDFLSRNEHDISAIQELTINAAAFDSIRHTLSLKKQAEVTDIAKSRATTMVQDLERKNFRIEDNDYTRRRHLIEWHRKYTFSLACLIFFFIGAPLGAIIRKGGLGLPVVISLLLFLFYYVIDNTNYKMARDGVISVWQGTWTSSAILALLGAFFSYKASNDSTILEVDTYIGVFKRLFGKRAVNTFERKELIIYETDYRKAFADANTLTQECRMYLQNCPFPPYFPFWDMQRLNDKLRQIVNIETSMVEELANSRNPKIILLLNQLPIIPLGRNAAPFRQKRWNKALGLAFPLGLAWYLQARYYDKRTRDDLQLASSVCTQLGQAITDMNLIN